MGKLILLNDVSTETDEADLLVGDTDPPCSLVGKKQSIDISLFFNEKVQGIDIIFSSDAQRIKTLVHRIRVESKDQILTSLTLRKFEALRERSFGVLNRTPYSFSDDIFQYSRIKPEKGESVHECRIRVMDYVLDIVNKSRDKTILLVSHPFVCQILFNAILQKDHTIITEFWTGKGSFVILEFEFGKYGVNWKLENAYNALVDSSYTQDEIYSRVFGKEGSFPR